MGVRVLPKDEVVERAMVFHHIFVVSEGLLAIIFFFRPLINSRNGLFI